MWSQDREIAPVTLDHAYSDAQIISAVGFKQKPLVV